MVENYKPFKIVSVLQGAKTFNIDSVFDASKYDGQRSHSHKLPLLHLICDGFAVLHLAGDRGDIGLDVANLGDDVIDTAVHNGPLFVGLAVLNRSSALGCFHVPAQALHFRSQGGERI